MTRRKLHTLLLLLIVLFLAGAAVIYYFSRTPAYEPLVMERTASGKTISFFDSPAKDPLKNAIDLAVSGDGKIYVADSDNHRIQVFDEKGKLLFKFGKYGSGKGKLNYPVGIVLDENSNVYVAELNNQRISVFSKEGRFKSLIGNKGFTPTSIAIDDEGFLYITDKTDGTIKKLTSSGKPVMTFGSFGKGEGQLYYPLGMDVAKTGDIYVSDTGNNRIQIFNKLGEYKSSLMMKAGPPSGIAIGEDGRIFYTEPMNGAVMMLEGENPSPIPLISSDETGSERLFFPEGIEVAGNAVYVTDKGSNRIYMYND